MKLVILLTILSTLVCLSAAQTASCVYGNYWVGTEEVYACGLTIDNPLGLELAEPAGIHQGSFTDDDVTGVVFRSGTTATVPSVLCNKFKNLRRFSLMFAGIKNITADCVSACRELKWLQISFNEVSSISSDAFRSNVNLTQLELNSDDFLDLPRTVFDSLVNLQHLDIGLNRKITDLSGYFKNLVNLDQLLLNELSLEHIDPEWFATNTKLKTVYFYGNRIKAIEADTLASFTSLEYLSLFGNEISTFAENAFVHLTNLRTLDLHTNPLGDLKNGTFRGMSNLITLDLGTSGIHNIHADAFIGLDSLTHLEMVTNELVMLPIGVFRPVPKLQFCGLYWNHMKAFKRSYFGDDLSELRVVDMDESDVRAITRDFFEDAINLSTISLVENEHCGNQPMSSFQDNRAQYMRKLEPCLRMGDMLVDTSTEASSDYKFYPIAMAGINIQVYTESELHIAVSPANYTTTPLIEILIGTAGNSKSMIIENQRTLAATVNTPNILKHGELNRFMVIWENHVISVHKDGEEFPFVAFTMSERFYPEFYGIKSMNSKAFWSNEPDDF